MENVQLERRLLDALAGRTGTDPSDWFLVFKARYGMEVVFSCIRDELGAGTVSTQLLTCCTAVDPILVAGMRPRYEEIAPATAAIDPARWELAEDARAVVLQHTYGIVDGESSRELARRARAASVPLVEDCAHCAGRMARDARGVPLADISVHSFGIEKMVPCLFGGAVWINPQTRFSGVASRCREALSELPPQTGRLESLCRHYLIELRVLSHLPGPLRRALWHGLPRVGLFEPAVTESERAGRLAHDAMRPGAWVNERALEGLAQLDGVEDRCRTATAIYREALAGVRGIEVPAAVLADEAQPLLRFPLLARDTAAADAIDAAVNAAGHYTSVWYRPELTPGVLDGAAYHLPGESERTERLAACDDFVARVACLPTKVSADDARAIARVVVECVEGLGRG